MDETAESRSDRRIKNKMAGPKGKTEVKLRSGRRLDALSSNRVGIEVERQGAKGIRKAVGRLKEAKQTRKALGAKLAVPQKDMGTAISEMRRQGVSGRVQNLSNTRSTYIRNSQPKSSSNRTRRSPRK